MSTKELAFREARSHKSIRISRSNLSGNMASQSPTAPPGEKKRKGKEGHPIAPTPKGTRHLPRGSTPKNLTGGFVFAEDIESTPRRRKNNKPLTGPPTPCRAHLTSSPPLVPASSPSQLPPIPPPQYRTHDFDHSSPFEPTTSQ